MSGDIIQITKTDDPWFPALLIVDEVKSWGVQAYTILPQSNDGSEKPGNAYRRLKFELFEKVGVAAMIVGKLGDGDEACAETQAPDS